MASIKIIGGTQAKDRRLQDIERGKKSVGLLEKIAEKHWLKSVKSPEALRLGNNMSSKRLLVPQNPGVKFQRVRLLPPLRHRSEDGEPDESNKETFADVDFWASPRSQEEEEKRRVLYSKRDEDIIKKLKPGRRGKQSYNMRRFISDNGLVRNIELTEYSLETKKNLNKYGPSAREHTKDILARVDNLTTLPKKPKFLEPITSTCRTRSPLSDSEQILQALGRGYHGYRVSGAQPKREQQVKSRNKLPVREGTMEFQSKQLKNLQPLVKSFHSTGTGAEVIDFGTNGDFNGFIRTCAKFKVDVLFKCEQWLNHYTC